MEVYSYHPRHGAYIGITVAEESPLEPGIFLYPAYTTMVMPREFGEGTIPVWDGEGWTNVPDHRGETWFNKNGDTVLVKQPGNPEKSGLMREQPPLPETALPVPVIDSRQIRLWLLGKGIVEDQVLKLINGLSDPDKSIASIEWEYADTFLHDHPFVQTLGQSIGLTPEDIEQGFREAAKL